jgi:hypothetical protein
VPSEVTKGDSAVFLGSSTPKLETSVSNQIGLLGGALSIGALFDIRSGDVIYNTGGLQLFDGAQREQNDSTTPLFYQARAIAATTQYGTSSTSLNIEKGGFVRWRELSVTYNIQPSFARRVRARTLSVTMAVRNLALWTDYHGLDPEVSNGNGAAQLPGTGSYTVSDPNIRSDNGGTVPLPRTWSIRFNLGL